MSKRLEVELSPKELLRAEVRDAQLRGEPVNEESLLRQRDEEINDGCRRFAGRRRYGATTEETPLDVLMAREMPLRDVVSPGDDDLELWAIRNETIRNLFAYLGQYGPNPIDVLRGLYAIGAHMGIKPFCELTLRERAKIFGDSHESHRWLLRKLCVDPLKRNGAKSFKAPGQKGGAASAAAHRCQQGNSNRRGGKKAAAKRSRKPTQKTA